MRRAAAILVVFAVAVIIPVISIAGACGPKPPCCGTSSGEPALTRGTCCVPDTCASSTREARDGNTVPSSQRASLQQADVVSPLPAVQTSAPEFPLLSEDEAREPDIHRRLASFSLLLI